jgi:hypothetical protein
MPAPKPQGLWILRVLVVIGSVLILSGGWLFESDFAKRTAARVAALPRSDRAGSQKLTSGTEVLLEGTLVAREPPGPRGFLVFYHERFTDLEISGASKGYERWIRIATVRIEGSSSCFAAPGKSRACNGFFPLGAGRETG